MALPRSFRARRAVGLFLCGLVWLLGSAAALAQQSPAAPAAVKPIRSGAASGEAFQLMTAEREALFRRCLPKVNDPAVQAVLDDPRLLLYTEREMPRAHQDWSGSLKGVHSPHYNISANDSEPFGNGNLEFPWGEPAGTHRSPQVRSFRFLWLPLDERGRPLPVVWYKEYFTDDGSQGYAWLYPVGAVVGEVLMLRGPDGHDYTFEMRLRIRERSTWGVNAFRPFPRAQDLAERIRELRPDFAATPRLAEVVRHLEQPVRMTRHTLADSHPGGSVFRQSMGVDSLPPLDDDELVAELLSGTTFQSALSEAWRQDDRGQRTMAPTTQASFHVVPAHYDAGFIEVEQESCMRCHRTVNQHVRRFDFSRDWYGRIRGSDGIFSFHPFSPGSISSNGFGAGVQMNGELTAAGIIAPFDPARHPNAIYHQIRGLE